MILRAFDHEHNQAAVAEQEYEAAKQHHHQVLTCRVAGNSDHDRRFHDAVERLEVARERFLQVLTA